MLLIERVASACNQCCQHESGAVVSWFKVKKESLKYLDLVESLNLGETVGNAYNLGGSAHFDTSRYQEHDESRRFALKDSSSVFQLVPVFVEFDDISKFKNSVCVKYKDKHLGWISKEDAEPIVFLLNSLPVGSYLAAVGQVSDYGRSKPGDSAKVFLGVSIYLVHQENRVYTSPLKPPVSLGKEKTDLQRQKDQELDALIKKRIKDLTSGNWDKRVLSTGDSVCFSQFHDNDVRNKLEQDALARGFIVSTTITRKLNLLVIQKDAVKESAKVKKAVTYGIAISDLDTYQSQNPLM